MPSITERFQGLMSTMWSSRSTTTDASPIQSPSLGVGANQASIIVSMSPTDAQEALPSTSSSSTESAANSGSTTFTARLRNIFNGIREKCSSAFATIRTNVASAFTRVVTWFSNFRGGNRDETEVRESSSDVPSSTPLTDLNAGQVEEPTAEEGQRKPSANLSAGEEVVDQTGLEISTGDVSDRGLDLDEKESGDGSADASSAEKKVETELFHSCISPAQVEEEAHVIEEAPLPAAAQGTGDELLPDADTSLDAIDKIAGGILPSPALEASFVSLTQALPTTFAEDLGRRGASSPRPPLFSKDEQELGSPDSFPRRASFANLPDLLTATQDQQASAGRRRSSSVELELRDLAKTPSTQAATSPSKGGGKHKARKK